MLRKSIAPIVLISLLLSSCQSSSEKNTEDISGIYSFQRLNGDYGELWIDKDMLVIKKLNEPHFTMLYQMDGDTLKMYRSKEEMDQGNNFDQILILDRSDSILHIRQDEYERDLKLISRDMPDLELNAQTSQTIQEEFRKRLKDQK